MLNEIASNGGLNTNGVEIESILFGIESSNFDSSVQSFREGRGFDFAGVDCEVGVDGERSNFREGFSYFTGLPSSGIPSNGLRRRFLILNGVAGSSSHQEWELLYNETSYTSSDKDTILSLIDSVQPGATVSEEKTYAEWAIESGLPEAIAGPDADADGDFLDNLTEFYFGLDPLKASPSPLHLDESLALSFPEARNLQGMSSIVETSTDLTAWEAWPVPDDAQSRIEGDTVDQVRIVFPESVTGDVERFFRLRISQE